MEKEWVAQASVELDSLGKEQMRQTSSLEGLPKEMLRKLQGHTERL